MQYSFLSVSRLLVARMSYFKIARLFHDGFYAKQQHFTLISAPTHCFYNFEVSQGASNQSLQNYGFISMPFSSLVCMHTRHLATNTLLLNQKYSQCVWRWQRKAMSSTVTWCLNRCLDSDYTAYYILLRGTDLLLCDKQFCANIYLVSLHFAVLLLHLETFFNAFQSYSTCLSHLIYVYLPSWWNLTNG